MIPGQNICPGTFYAHKKCDRLNIRIFEYNLKGILWKSGWYMPKGQTLRKLATILI